MEYDIKTNLAGTVFYYIKGTNIIHREDGPAIICTNGDQMFYNFGKKHRENGPAAEWANGNKTWYINGKCHRENGPAVEWANGDNEWFINGKLLSYEKEIILNKWWNNKNGI